MCGIAGVIGGRGEAERVVAEQLLLLRHRGPDADGSFGDGRSRIGQTRLAVIDLETGDPPLTDESGEIGAVLNGELYNFRALRRELLEDGHQLSSTGDTEVLAHLAESLEPIELARRLEGMFAFAVWDRARHRLILGRDRVGKKPLYCTTAGGAFVFASELKGVLAHPDVPRELEPRAIPAYLTFGYVPTPLTFYRDVVSVPPGHVLVVERGHPPKLQRYWSPPTPASSAPSATPEEAARLVRRSLDAAVQRRLIADVPLGAFLSGGIDSAAIVALMAQHSAAPVRTFTIGFADRDGFDERPFAEIVARRYSTEHHAFVVSPNAVELVERLLWHHDQPFGDSSAIPTYLLAEQTRAEVTVALSGDGGDELFAGYERFAAAVAVDRYARLPAVIPALAGRALARAPASALRGRAGSLRRFSEAAGLGLPDAYREWVAFFGEDQRRRLFSEPDGWALRDFDAMWESSAGAPSLSRLLDLNLRTYLVDDLLVKADRMSMAHGLEVRSPFLDTALLELALTLPPSYHLRGFSRKRLLKAAVTDLLPSEILTRRKRGFAVPLDRWFREDLATYVGSLLGGPSARVKHHLGAAEVDRYLHEHATGARQHGQRLWALLTLELFLRREGW